MVQPSIGNHLFIRSYWYAREALGSMFIQEAQQLQCFLPNIVVGDITILPSRVLALYPRCLFLANPYSLNCLQG